MASSEENSEDVIRELPTKGHNTREENYPSARRKRDGQKSKKQGKALAKWEKDFNGSDNDEDEDPQSSAKWMDKNKRDDYRGSEKKATSIKSPESNNKRGKKSKMRNDVAIDMTDEEGLVADQDDNEDSNKRPRKGRKFFKTRNSPRQDISPKSREHFEQSKLWKKIGILDGKDRMMWARRAFFMSTEQIFPGFTRNYSLSSKGRDPAGIKLRSSVPLKVCLLAHSYFVPMWFLGFIVTHEFSTRSLKPLHSYVHTCITYISLVTDILRLYAGFLSNTKDDMQLLALYWMATVILQTPMLCFIFATHSFSTWLLPLNVSVDILLGSILTLEIWFGFWQLKGLVSSEINLLYMARQMHDVVLIKDRGKKSHPHVINCPDKGPHLDWSTSSEGSGASKNASEKANNKQGSSKTKAKISKKGDKPTEPTDGSASEGNNSVSGEIF